jgi:acyl carrier protein
VQAVTRAVTCAVNHNVERLMKLIERELGVDPATLAPDTLLSDIADSLDWASLLTAIERQFKLRVEVEHGLQLRTVSDLVQLVAEPGLACA